MFLVFEMSRVPTSGDNEDYAKRAGLDFLLEGLVLFVGIFTASLN